MRIVLILCIAGVMAPGWSGAQSAPPIADWPLAVGSRVRILSPVLGDKQKIGTVISATWDTLVFLPVKQSASTAIATPNIVRIEVAKAKHTHTANGALMGFLIFGGAGAFMANVSYRDCHNCLWQSSRRFDTETAGAVCGLLGTLVGAAVGGRKTDTWVPVAVPVR